MMRCKICGAEVEPSDNYCRNCGRALHEDDDVRKEQNKVIAGFAISTAGVILFPTMLLMFGVIPAALPPAVFGLVGFLLSNSGIKKTSFGLAIAGQILGLISIACCIIALAYIMITQKNAL